MPSFNDILLKALLLASTCISSPLNPSPNSDPPNVEIVLQNITYSSRTRFWGPGSVRTGIATVEFNISNTQAPLIHCSAWTPEGGYNDGYFRYINPMTYYCDHPSGDNRIPANFTFSRFSNEIIVNQTWSGPPIGGFVPIYNATASGNAKLNCSLQEWTNPDWKPNIGQGIDYSTRDESCTGADLMMRIDKVTAVL